MIRGRPARKINDIIKKKISVFTYVKKFILRKYLAAQVKKSNNSADVAYKVSEHDMFGKILITVILDKRNLKKEKKLKGADETLQIILTQDMMSHSPSLVKLQRANFYYDKMFKDAMIEWVISSIYQNDKYSSMKALSSIKNFLKYYDIEEAEYSCDAAYKYWMRWKRENM